MKVTQQDYNRINGWIVGKCRVIGLVLNDNFSSQDIFADAYIKSAENQKSLFKNIINSIYENYYIQCGKIQNGKPIPATYEKKCSRCLEVKNQAEFYLKRSSKYQLVCLSHVCKECNRIIQSEKFKERYHNDLEFKNKRNLLSRNYKQSEEQKRKISEKNKKLRQDPEYRIFYLERKRQYREKYKQMNKKYI